MSSDAFDAFPDAEELLGGLPAKRANTLLFLIETRTAHLVARSRQAMERFLTEDAAEERELAFVEAFSLGKEPPLRPSIQDIERYSTEWAPLVPENARVAAAVAHRLGEKYEFAYADVPGVRAALRLDEPTVAEAYERLYRKPLTTIFAPRARRVERLRWGWATVAARLENLPPFWAAYALTLTETVGASILALPIAVAALGPLPGVAVLVVLGFVNVLTVAFIAEAVSRSGAIRHGSAFFGRLVLDYLGRGGSLVLTMSLFVLCVLILPIYYFGIAITLENATRVPDAIWLVLVFVVAIYYLQRESLNATIASALLVGAVNIGLILVLSSLALSNVRPDNFLYENVPFIGGNPFERSLVALIFGVVLAAYFGHTSVAICGQLVLRRDPSARSLIWGCAAAQATAVVLYCVFVLAVNGAVAPRALADEPGTALAPLAEAVGPAVHVFGSVFVVLGMGMASITFSLALFGLVRERLPSASPRLVTLPRRRARLVFRERRRWTGGDGVRVGLTYLGLHDREPHFRVDVETSGGTHRIEASATGRWEVLGVDGAGALVERRPDLADARAELALEISDADDRSVRLRISSNMSVGYEGKWDVAGLGLADVVSLPEPDAALAAWIMRRGEATLSEAAAEIGHGEADARSMLDSLVEHGVISERTLEGEQRYTARPVARRGGRLGPDIWRALAEEDDASVPHGAGESPGSFGRAERLRELVFGERGRFAIGATPVLAAFLASEWMVLTGSGSFAGLLSFVGVIVVSILAGVFPVLLLVASRRKGEYVPTTVYRLLGNRVLLAAVYLLFLASVFLHGLVIWDGTLERVGALLVGAGIVAMTITMARRGAFRPRTTVELRDDESEGKGRFSVTAGGRHATADVRLDYPDGEKHVRAADGEVPRFASLRTARFELSRGDERADRPGELKVWAHRVTADGESEPLPGWLAVRLDGETKQFDLELSRGQTILPLKGTGCEVKIALREPDEG